LISYIDEAGTFVSKGASENSWCTVACYSHPEFEKRKLAELLRQLKLQEGFTQDSEVKLKNISENGYLKFLQDLSQLNGALFCVATDSNFNSLDKINSHKDAHVESILRGQSEMKYDGGKEAMKILHKQLSGLPEQLYVQFHCQAVLLSSFIQRGIAFYVQRYPNSLKSFRWRYDAKELLKITDFEDSFQKFVPALLQAYSIDNPTAALDWCDYSPMKKYISTIPDYLAEKVPELEGQEAFDIQKIIRDDIQFIDSKSSSGIQVADLLASGLRRLLRLEFSNNPLVAKSFGKLLLQEEGNKPPISLVAFDGESQIHGDLAVIIKTMISNCQRIIK
jgi:hypothetical protein